MISHEETMCLIKLSQEGDNQATATLIAENTPLLKSMVKRYLGKHVEYDDLFQIASIGLLKAIKNFQLEFGVKFSTYAVPMILGEIKRHMRDDGYLKVSRSLKTLSAKINRYVEEFKKQSATDPTVNDIANHFKMDVADVVFAMESAQMPISLYESTNDSDGKPLQLIDRIATDDNEKMMEKLVLKDIISKLTPREQAITYLRYYKDLTQGEIAKRMGVSQVQISRIENKIIQKLKDLYEEQ